MNNRGITLILILALILTVIVLANIALLLISSQARFTHHQVSRIRAFYAAQAGINYTLERLRVGAWVPDPSSITYYCINDNGTTMTCTDGNINDTDVPFGVEIRVWPEGGGSPAVAGTTQLEAKAEYTYTP